MKHEALKFRLAPGVAVIVITGHALLLTLLYLSLGAVLQRSHERPFVQKVHIFSQLVAQQLEAPRMAESPAREMGLLDTVIQNGEGVYAELVGPGVHLRSALGPPAVQFPPFEDSAFGEHNDEVYFTRVPVVQGDRTLWLQLGFDEHLTVVAIRDAKRRMLRTMSVYLGASALAALLLSYLVANSVRRLQAAARQIATGAYATELRLRTPVTELHELSLDLEHMRSELVGTNERLRAQIEEKDRIEQQRVDLERQLRHRQRVETVGTLAGGIAHEFNNVLVPITLLSELSLKRLPEGHESRADLITIRDAARRARELTKQILAFSRDLGSLALESVDVREVVEEALKLLRPLVSPNLELRTEFAPQACVVRADRGLLLQLLMNLCKNAYQAIPSGEGVVAIGVRSIDVQQGARADLAAGRYVELSVRDTGAGMEPAVSSRIFEPFFSTRAIGEGTGLGLSVALGIVETFGAHVHVDSAPGAGSTFTVLFPALGADSVKAAT